MKKIQILSTTFELPDDSALIILGYISKLDLYAARGKISPKQHREILLQIESSLHTCLQSGTEITDTVAYHIIDATEHMVAPTPLKNSQGWFLSFWSFIGKLLTMILNFIGKLLRVIFFASIALFTIALALGLLLLVPMMFVNPTIDNQIIFGMLPEATKWILLLLETSLIIISLGFFASAWKSSNGGQILRTIGYITLFIALNGIVYTAFSVSYNYGNTYTKIAEQEITSSGTIIPMINASARQNLNLKIRRNDTDYRFTTSKVSISKESGNSFKIRTTTTIFARDEGAADAYYSKLQPLKFVFSGSSLEVDPLNNGKAKEPIIFQGGMRVIEVEVNTAPTTVSGAISK